RKTPVKALINTSSKFNTISKRLFNKLEEDYGLEGVSGDDLIDDMSIPLIERDDRSMDDSKSHKTSSDNKHQKNHHGIFCNITPVPLPSRRLNDDVPKNSRASKNKKYPKVDLGDGCGKLSLKTHLNNIWKSVHSIENDIEYGIFEKLHIIEYELSCLNKGKLPWIKSETDPSNSCLHQNKSKKGGGKYFTDLNTDTFDTSTSYSSNSGPEGMAPKKSNKDTDSKQLEKNIKSRPPLARLAKEDIDCIMYARDLKGGSKKVSEWYKIGNPKCNKIWKSEDPYSYANSIGEPNLPEWYIKNTKISPDPAQCELTKSQEIDIPEEPKPDPIEVKRKRKTTEMENIACRVLRFELGKLVIEE
ncbi:7992_t:CDS:2, partial [Diversispora eburnea]